jgi:predicted TIM-barrel fold metal-dependent hydrolase
MPAHVERLRAVFQAANRGRAPIVIHLRTMNPEYGRRDAEVFLNDVLASAPDIPVQIAHLAGWGGYGRETEEALSVFAEAFAAGDRRVAHLYFDVSIGNVSTEAGDRLARHLRQIGLDRILFGVDRATPIDGVWASLTRLPLDAAELRQIAANLAPYLR